MRTWWVLALPGTARRRLVLQMLQRARRHAMISLRLHVSASVPPAPIRALTRAPVLFFRRLHTFVERPRLIRRVNRCFIRQQYHALRGSGW